MGVMAESGSFTCSSSEAFEHTSFDGGFVGVVFENIPATHLDVFNGRPGGQNPDRGAAAFGALSQANGPELSQGTDGLPDAALDGFQPGDERGRHRTHAGYQYTQFALGRRDLDVV